MPIIIPSKRTYDISSALVNKNVISSVEVEVSKLTQNSSVKPIYRIAEDISGIKRFPPLITEVGKTLSLTLSEYQTFKNVETSSITNKTYISFAGIKPFYETFEFSIPTQISDNSFVSCRENEFISVSVKKTIEKRERRIWVTEEEEELTRVEIIADYETENNRAELDAPRQIVNATILGSCGI